MRVFAAQMAAVAILAGLTGAGATAQIVLRPIPVKNVDEPGRTPYQSTTADSCSAYPCVLLFERVPLGKRLVVQYIGGSIQSFDAGGSPPRVEILTNCHLLSGCPAQRGTLVPPFRAFASDSEVNRDWGLSERLLAYVEESALPGIRLYTGAPPRGSAVATFTITGYLIDKSN